MARTNSKSSSLMTSFFVVQANTDSREKTMRSDLAVNTGQIEIFWHLSHLEPHAYFVLHRGHWISFQSALLIQILPASNLELHSRIYNSFSHASKPTHVTGGLPFNCSWSTGRCWRNWLQGVWWCLMKVLLTNTYGFHIVNVVLNQRKCKIFWYIQFLCIEKQQQMKEVFLLVLQTLYQFALQLLDFGMPDVDSESSLLLLLELQSQGV